MTGVSTLGQALSRIDLLNDQNRLLGTLTTQLATGKKTQSFEGLNSNVLASKRARASFQSLEIYTNNIKIADQRIRQTLNSIEEFQAQAENFATALVQFSQQSVHQEGDIITYDDPFTTEVETTKVGVTSADPDADLTILKGLAETLFSFMGELLNAQDGERYLLGGSDNLNQPYTDTGTLEASINTLVKNWKDETLAPGVNLTNAELINTFRTRDASVDSNAITDTIIGYSAELSAGNAGDVRIRADDRIDLKYTALANEQPFRDILVATAFIKNDTLIPIADVYAEPYAPGDPTLADGAPGATLDEMKDNFFEVFNDLTAMVNVALDKIDTVRYRLENVRARISEISDAHAKDKFLFLNTIEDVENVDINEVAVQINLLQVQLDASYRVTASVQQLSLVNFL